MAAVASPYRNFTVAFKSDGVNRIQDADEIIVGDEHYTGNDLGLEIDHALGLVQDHDAFFMEGYSLFSPMHGYDNLMGSYLPSFKIFGWDYNEDGLEARGDFVPEFWKFYENESLLNHKLSLATDDETRESLNKQLDYYKNHPKRVSFREQALDNWNRRQESLITALEVSGNLRKLKNICFEIDGQKVSVNPNVVFKRSVLQTGLSHVLGNVRYPELLPSIDRLHKFLRDRKAVILVPKSCKALE